MIVFVILRLLLTEFVTMADRTPRTIIATSEPTARIVDDALSSHPRHPQNLRQRLLERALASAPATSSSLPPAATRAMLHAPPVCTQAQGACYAFNFSDVDLCSSKLDPIDADPDPNCYSLGCF